MGVYIKLVARLFQQDWYSDGITILIQPCVVNFVIISYSHYMQQELFRQPFDKSDQVFYMLSTSFEAVYNLRQALQTHLVDDLFIDLLKSCEIFSCADESQAEL